MANRTPCRPQFTGRLMALVAAALLVVSGCSKSSSTRAAESTTPTKQPAKAVTVAQLRGILPDAADAGDGYKVRINEDDTIVSEDPSLIAAAKEQCPEAVGFFADNSSNPHVATRSYAKPDGRWIDVELAPDAQQSKDFGTAVELDERITEISKCPTLSFDEGDGSHMVVKMKAMKTSDFGDVGMLLDLEIDVTSSGTELMAPIHGTGRARLFEVGTVGVLVQASGSVDPNTNAFISPDNDAVDSVSKVLATRAVELQS